MEIYSKIERLIQSDSNVHQIFARIEMGIQELLHLNDVIEQQNSTALLNFYSHPSAAEAKVGTNELSIADLKLDRMSRKVTRAGKKLVLKPREFTLLEFMLLNQNQVLTRQILLENVWEYYFDPKTNFLEVHISNLRKKIDGNAKLRLVRTVRNIGYILSDSED